MLVRLIVILFALIGLSSQVDAQVIDVLAQRLGADPEYLVLNVPSRPGAWPGAIFTDDLRVPIVRGREDDPELRRGSPISIEATDVISFGAGANANVKSWFSFAAKASESGKVLISFPDTRVVDLTYEEIQKRIEDSRFVLDAIKRGHNPLVVIRAYEGTPTIKISKEAAASAEARANLTAAATEANVQAGVFAGDYVVYRAMERIVFAFETMKAITSAESPGGFSKVALQKSPASVFVAYEQSQTRPTNGNGVIRVRATIESVNGQTLDVKTREGATTKVQLAPNAPVNEVLKAALSDIKQGDYIAVTAMPQPDGTQKAVAILIFPAAMRGVGEGYRPWDLSPGSTMTNATVASQVTGVDGSTLNVSFKGGQQKVVVPANAQIVAYKKATAADLKAGQKIFVAAAKKLPNGTLEAPNVAFGDYGVWR